MTDARSPKIDNRNALQIAAQTELLARRLVVDESGRRWDPPPGRTDPGRTLIALFSHLMEQVIDRLNRVPDKQRHIFAHLAGLQPLQPLPARVPVSFTASPDATPTVPKGSLLTADPADGDPDPLQYETDDDLTVHPVELIELGGASAPTPARPTATGERWLYLTHPLFDLATDRPTTFTITGASLRGLQRWDSRQWRDIPDPGSDAVALASLAPRAVAGRTARWLRLPAPNGALPSLSVRIPPAVPSSPDAATVGRAPVDPTATIRPFGFAPAPGDAFHLRSDRVLSRVHGRAVTLHVTGVFPGVARQPPIVQWQYWDGAGWTNAAQSDGTANFTTDGTITLSNLAPRPSPTGGWWLRALLTAGAFGETREITTRSTVGNNTPIVSTVTLDLPPAPDQVPRFAGLTLTLDAEDDPTPAELVIQDGPRFTTLAAADDDAAPDLLLALARPFANRPVALFVELLPPDDPPPSASPTWSYSTASTWKPLALLTDGTDGLRRTGIVTFIGPADMAPRIHSGRRAAWLAIDNLPAGTRIGRVRLNTVWATQTVTIAGERLGPSTGLPDQRFRTARAPVLDGERVAVDGATWTRVDDLRACGPDARCYRLDRSTGDISFGDGIHGAIPPRSADELRIDYRTGGGLRGDRPAGAVKALERSIPGVAEVRNDLPAVGGRDAETPAQLAARTARWLRHRDRAVAAQDYADLAMEASPRVARAWVVPLEFNTADGSAAPSGANEVRIVLATDDRDRDHRPTPELLSAVDAYLAGRAPAGVTVRCLPPAIVRRHIEVTIAGDGDLGPLAEATLAAFLDPIHGGPDGHGFPPGALPRSAELLEVLARVPGLTAVTALTLPNPDVAPPSDALVVSTVTIQVS